MEGFITKEDQPAAHKLWSGPLTHEAKSPALQQLEARIPFLPAVNVVYGLSVEDTLLPVTSVLAPLRRLPNARGVFLEVRKEERVTLNTHITWGRFRYYINLMVNMLIMCLIGTYCIRKLDALQIIIHRDPDSIAIIPNDQLTFRLRKISERLEIFRLAGVLNLGSFFRDFSDGRGVFNQFSSVLPTWPRLRHLYLGVEQRTQAEADGSEDASDDDNHRLGNQLLVASGRAVSHMPQLRTASIFQRVGYGRTRAVTRIDFKLDTRALQYLNYKVCPEAEQEWTLSVHQIHPRGPNLKIAWFIANEPNINRCWAHNMYG